MALIVVVTLLAGLVVSIKLRQLASKSYDRVVVGARRKQNR